MARLTGALGAGLALGLLAAVPAQADGPVCDARMRLHPSGNVEVSGEFSGLPPELTALELFTGTKDAGVLKLEVTDGRASFSYSSVHQLHREAEGLFLGSPDFYVPGAPLDLALSVQYPPVFELLGAEPPPADRGLGSLRWEESGVAHFVVVLHFAWRGRGLPPALEDGASADSGSSSGPAGAPSDTASPGGADTSDDAASASSAPAESLPPAGAPFDPADLPPLRPGEEAQSAQQLLEELAFAIKLARAEGQSDPGFLDALEKFLAKLYAYFREKELAE